MCSEIQNIDQQGMEERESVQGQNESSREIFCILVAGSYRGSVEQGDSNAPSDQHRCTFRYKVSPTAIRV